MVSLTSHWNISLLISSEVKLGNKFSFAENDALRFPASVSVVLKRVELNLFLLYISSLRSSVSHSDPTKKDHIAWRNAFDINSVLQQTQHSTLLLGFLDFFLFSGPPKLHFLFMTNMFFFTLRDYKNCRLRILSQYNIKKIGMVGVISCWKETFLFIPTFSFSRFQYQGSAISKCHLKCKRTWR